MTFKGWQKTSLIDYPDKISSVLFCGGCNLRCPFCYNRDLVLYPGKLDDLPGETVLEYLLENRALYQAVCVTGGEPTLYDELPAFLAQVKELGLLVGLETNGTRRAMLEELIAACLVDFIAMDLKAPLVFEKYRQASGNGDEKIFRAVMQSVELITASEIAYEFRFTVVPEIHRSEDVLELGSQIKGARRLVLQQFSPEQTLDRALQNCVPYPEEQFLEWQEKLKPLVGDCALRNL